MSLSEPRPFTLQEPFALKKTVTANWPIIRAGLLSQLRRRGCTITLPHGDAIVDDEALAEAVAWFWEFALSGNDHGLCVWKAAARVAERRSFVRQRDLRSSGRDYWRNDCGRRCIECLDNTPHRKLCDSCRRIACTLVVTEDTTSAKDRRLMAGTDR